MGRSRVPRDLWDRTTADADVAESVRVENRERPCRRSRLAGNPQGVPQPPGQIHNPRANGNPPAICLTVVIMPYRLATEGRGTRYVTQQISIQ